jgi:hypothetical protein
MIDGTGFNTNYSMPYIKYFDWFVDGYRTFKKNKEVEGEKTGSTNSTTTRRMQGELTKLLELGPLNI